MAAVAEVGRPPALTRVPGLPAWVAGVANWRGRVLAVLDVRPLLGGGQERLDRRGRLLVLAVDGVEVGVLLEEVLGILPGAAGPVEPPLASLPGPTAGLLAGQVTTAEGPVGLLDVPALLGLAASLPHARSA